MSKIRQFHADKERNPPLIQDQKWYHLGTLLSGASSLPAIILGKQLSMQYGTGTAIFSILVANLILWVIGMAVISMASENRSNSIENVKSYLGKYGALFMWLLLMITLLNWFDRQLNTSLPSIGEFFGTKDQIQLVRLGVGIALITTALSLGGMRLMKPLIISSFPFIFGFYVFSIFRSDFSIRQISGFSLSLSAIISTIFVNLLGVLNLPTLFRHARSKADSYLGLAVLAALLTFFEISAIWMPLDNAGIFIHERSWYAAFATFLFTLLTLIYINLINIYYASACWETYIPRFEGTKGYAIIGLMGTATFILLQSPTPIHLITDLTNCYIASLGIVLVIAYLYRIVVRHRPRKFDMAINGLGWLFGCIVSSIYIFRDHTAIDSLIAGAVASASACLCIIFIEESIWAAKEALLDK